MARDRSNARRGVSLAKGPVGVLGLLGILYGLSALLFSSHGFALHVPHGAVHGKKWIGLQVNGWSELLFLAAGLALLLAAPLHWGAKGMSLLVGGVMLAAAVIAVVRKDGVFGIFAANHLTELVWAAAGVLLLLLALLPRVGRREAREPPAEGAVARGESAERHPRPRSRRRVVRRARTSVDSTPPHRHARWTRSAEAQDRPLSAGAQRSDEHPELVTTRLDKETHDRDH